MIEVFFSLCHLASSLLLKMISVLCILKVKVKPRLISTSFLILLACLFLLSLT